MVQYVPTRVTPIQRISRGAIIMSILSFTFSLVLAFIALASLYMFFKTVQDVLAPIGQIQSQLRIVPGLDQIISAESFVGIALVCFVVSTLMIPIGLLFMAIQLKKYA